MPARTDLKSVMILGAGPIVIGQACEFDYSGAQACKALKEVGYRVILVNSNPATIMTDAEFADATYIEPLDPQVVEKIIERERPDALLSTMGGQTGLNCALALAENGVLERCGVELIGAKAEAINKAEDREQFRAAMKRIDLATVPGRMARSMDDAFTVIEEIGFPAIVRPSYTLGGSGGGIAHNPEEFTELTRRALAASPVGEVLVETSIFGWKEFEMEVVRDQADNSIIICSIENIDPIGVHTGDSLTVAPAQTLTDKEYQQMRDASLAVLREIGVETGGSNVQFALDPNDGRMVVVEMNPRVSRSSALASKATGFPIAKVAAKLAVGFTLDELRNEITAGATPASFEPTLDYAVIKIPRFDFVKFPGADATLTLQMKSVGETMAIGRSFNAALQKALCALELGWDGLCPPPDWDPADSEAERLDQLRERLALPRATRILYIAEAFRHGLSLEEIQAASQISHWFLAEIEQLVLAEREVAGRALPECEAAELREWKRMGFADSRLATLMGATTEEVAARRAALGVYPVFKRVDSCAAEFATDTAYLYSCYEEECEAAPTDRKKIIILGGGPNRIGQGIEFDYCCVHAAMALRERGFETLMINSNPETVSTDYDTADRLYFEPLALEQVLDIVRLEQPTGVIVQYGGQTPLKLAEALDAAGVPIIGTSAAAIHEAEDRAAFQSLLERLGLKQPPNRIARDAKRALQCAEELGYPLVVRPSFVLGGRAMAIIHDEAGLLRYLSDTPFSGALLLERFLSNAIEVDVDAVSDGSRVCIAGVMQHIESAGVHSGDSGCALPPFSLTEAEQAALAEQTVRIATEIGVVGLLNIQFALQEGVIYVLEVNPRASRTVPFVSKVTGRDWAKIGALCMVGESLVAQGVSAPESLPYFAVKEAVLPFIKFPSVDPVLGPEMKSTGEVMGVGETFGAAYRKAQLAAGSPIPQSGRLLVSLAPDDFEAGLEVCRYFAEHGFDLTAAGPTADHLLEAGLPLERLPDSAAALAELRERRFALLIVTADQSGDPNAGALRRQALAGRIGCFTTLPAARAATEAHAAGEDFEVYQLQALHKRLSPEREPAAA